MKKEQHPKQNNVQDYAALAAFLNTELSASSIRLHVHVTQLEGSEMYRLLSLVVVLSVSSAANAQLLVKPKTPTPRPLIREAFMPKGEVLLSYPMEATLDGKPIWLWKYHHRKVNDLVVTNALGEKLTEQEIRKTLRKPTMVLISADGKPVHPYYLKVMRPETMVVIDMTPKRDTSNREPVKLKTQNVDLPNSETPKKK